MKRSLMKLTGVLITLVFLAGCSKEDEPKSLSQQQLEKLSGTWNLTSANDGTDRNDFVGVVLTIPGTFNNSNPLGPYTYTFTGTFPNPSPWPETGNWSFVEGEEGTTFIRNADDVAVTYVVADHSLQLSFTYDGAGYDGGVFGRGASVDGSWTFEFER